MRGCHRLSLIIAAALAPLRLIGISNAQMYTGMAVPFPNDQHQGADHRTRSSVKANQKNLNSSTSQSKANGSESPNCNPDEAFLRSDSELISQVGAGDGEALADLVERYRRFIFQIALRILKDKGEAQEVVQETSLKLCSVAKSFDALKGTFPNWLARIAVTTALKRRQYLKARKFYDAVDIEDVDGCSAGLADDYLQMAPQEQSHLAHELLSKLKPAQRRAIELKCGEGFTAEQGALSTGESSSAFENHFYRGLKKLRDLARKERGKTK